MNKGIFLFKTARKIASVTVATALAFTIMPLTSGNAVTEDVFFDDFDGTTLNTDNWLIAEKNWGGTIEKDGKTIDYNGGVIPENVALQDGSLVLTGLGDQYEGPVRGIGRDLDRREDGKRCGGAIATREYFGSGSYEIRAKIAPVTGCCSAMWTFEYEEYHIGDDLKIINHEIDIEFPGRNEKDEITLDHVLCTTWTTEDDYKTKSVNCGPQTDGEYHTYRFDWHTGSDSKTPRVEYYFDGELKYTSFEFIPTNESRFWLGLWFPKNWAGTPDFDTTEFVIDYVKITPFHESGDTPQHESYSDHGWAKEYADLPKGWLLWHSYGRYADLNSALYLKDPDGNIKEITGDFHQAMNGSFGVTPDTFAFMAIDNKADEWDIYVSRSGKIPNLTKNSGFRNEDPKWSPDGKSIIFKRGYWDNSIGDFKYDLAVINTDTGTVTMLTDDITEEAMPYYSSDGKSVYYAAYDNGIGCIRRFDTETGTTETIFDEVGVNAYYPVINGNDLYFTRWVSTDNHCDQLVKYNGRDFVPLPCNSDKYDCSDICPVTENSFVYSTTCDGEYDLYYYNGKASRKIALSTDKNDLGADFFSYTDYEKLQNIDKIKGDINEDGKFDSADVLLLQEYLLGMGTAEPFSPDAADMNENGKVDVYDLCLIKCGLLK